MFSWPKIVGAGVVSKCDAWTSVPQIAAICICTSAPPLSIGNIGNSCISSGLPAPVNTAAIHLSIIIPPSDLVVTPGVQTIPANLLLRIQDRKLPHIQIAHTHGAYPCGNSWKVQTLLDQGRDRLLFLR